MVVVDLKNIPGTRSIVLSQFVESARQINNLLQFRRSIDMCAELDVPTSHAQAHAASSDGILSSQDIFRTSKSKRAY